MKTFLYISITGVSLVAVATPVHSQAPDNAAHLASIAALEQTLVDVIARTEPSVVAIGRTAPQPQPLIVGGLGDAFGDLRAGRVAVDVPTVAAGVVIDQAGLVLTTYQAVRERDSHSITTTAGHTYPATIRGADPRSGLAVLIVEPAARPLQRPGDSDNEERPSFRPLAFGDSDALRKGQFVVAIGNPHAIRHDGQPTASWGIVTNLSRKLAPGDNFNDIPGPANDYRTTLYHLGALIQTDAKLGWGAGGGALVNLRGELVGLTTTAATIAGHEQPAGYAIPINAAFRRIIDDLKQGREVEYGLLGVSFRAELLSPDDPTRSAVTIQQVIPASPAAYAGLEVGDVVTHVAGQRITDVDTMQLAVSLMPPATAATIRYERQGREASTEVTLAKLSVPGAKVVTNRPNAWQGIRVDYATALDAGALSEVIAAGIIDPAGCVVVSDVEPDSPAWRADVRPGMFVSHVGDQRVTTPAEFHAAVRGRSSVRDLRFTQPISQTFE